MHTHVPVLLQETVEILSPKVGDRILDVTLGLGGHSELLLHSAGDRGSLIALDADTENIAHAEMKLEKFGTRVKIVHANFSELPGCLPEDRRQFDVILADLGLSSPHIDDPSRGFTFRADAPLDMRFDRTTGMTAALLLASLDEVTLLKIFQELGELPSARRFTDAIVARRKDSPVRKSGDLVETANLVYGYKAPRVLPQIFQALRMAVNRESEALQNFLLVVPALLAPGGRCAVISYHSLEDSPVKTSFRELCRDGKDPFTGSVTRPSEFELLTKKGIAPTASEIEKNSRSRSARLRAIRKRKEYDSRRIA
ncbi:16S rRNA (cytosine(1402)-N(4))-methyltransferase RsmH [Candidatus Peribacteria bacterium]|nr:16S rRNA (cytosine(1402)-N(4))-methyltransferase RsmH [Candidatus Peribacteria bacterium]